MIPCEVEERSIVGLALDALLLVWLLGDEVKFQQSFAMVKHGLGILTHGCKTHLSTCEGEKSCYT